jgi:pyruvate dehydrogenase E2 component (dihydrolipoamide acetyltransferase)
MAELLRMPEIAAGMESAILSTWLITENTPHSAGDVIAVIETDKAVVDFEAESDGVLVRILVADGAEVPVGAPIALIASIGETVTDIDAMLEQMGAAGSGKTSSPTPAEPESPALPVATASTPSVAASEPIRVFASPLARRLAKDARLDVGRITGTGPGGRIVRRDVEAAMSVSLSKLTEHRTDPSAESATAPALASVAFTEVPHTRLRRAIANRLTESKQTAPHFYLRGSANVDRLLTMREEINSGGTTRVSVNDLVLKAVAAAHVLVPAMNVTWTPDATRHHRGVDISVAIATDNGLVTPVLRSVEAMSVSGIAEAVKGYVDRARAGRLQQNELEGGTISVTNLGMYGTEEFAAIINPPQASILAVGVARREAVVINDQVAVASVIRVTLSIDHRPVDGVVAAQWMKEFLRLLEQPARILA